MGYRSKFSLLLVGSFLSWQSSPAAFAQDPAQPHLSFYFNGPNAAQNLADAYGILKSKHPGLLYGNTHRQVTSACAAKGDFFDMAICEHIWPKEAWRISSFKQRFDTANLGSRNKSSAEDNRLPWTTVETEFTRDSVADPTIKSINDLTPSRRKLLCKMHSWDFFSSDALAELLPNFPTQQSGDCILRVDVVEQRATEKPIPAKIILLQPAYYLRLHATTEPSDMLKAESDVVKGVLAEDPSAIGNVLPRLKVGAPRAQTGTVDLTSFCTKENILAGRRLLHWPEQANGKSQSYLVIADPGVTQPITFGDESYNSPFLHPEDGNAGTLSFLCKDTIHDQLSDLERWVHAMSVATIAYGGHADILIGDEEKVHFSGLLQPGDGQFVPTSWVGRNQAFIPIPYVIVGSYDNQFRQTPQAMQQIYAAVKDTVSTARGLPIFAASERSGDRPANFRTDGGISHPNAYPSASECDELPTCLGATPTAMVVAALDSDGATLLNPEYYRLGSSVVWVAAPGSRMMTAVPSDDGTLKFAVESGSSFAAPAVAAIALALEAQQYGSLENWQVMARIAASSDLYKTDEKDATTGTNLVDLVRFGRVNASRAIQGAARGEDAIWFRGDAEPIYRHIEAPMGLPKGPDYKDTAWVCANDYRTQESEDNALRGYIRVFEHGVLYGSGPLGRRAQPQCIGINDILRLVYDDSERARPTFTMVYFEQRHGSYDGFKEPKIIRGKLLASDEGMIPPPCAIDGRQSAGLPACLYALEPGSQRFKPINLVGTDIMFSPKHYSGSRAANPGLWTEVKAAVWSKQ